MVDRIDVIAAEKVSGVVGCRDPESSSGWLRRGAVRSRHADESDSRHLDEL